MMATTKAIRRKGEFRNVHAIVGTSSFLDEYRFPIQQPLLPLSFRLRRKLRQHQWRGLFETRRRLSQAGWLRHLVHS